MKSDNIIYAINCSIAFILSSVGFYFVIRADFPATAFFSSEPYNYSDYLTETTGIFGVIIFYQPFFVMLLAKTSKFFQWSLLVITCIFVYQATTIPVGYGAWDQKGCEACMFVTFSYLFFFLPAVIFITPLNLLCVVIIKKAIRIIKAC